MLEQYKLIQLTLYPSMEHNGIWGLVTTLLILCQALTIFPTDFHLYPVLPHFLPYNLLDSFVLM